ncbi:MAG: hypothetical protein R3190_16940, partial [Thermoanaerobaculia bacterium]|nr:hypothetical protein [Thermoanaerobaculia bacterium]
LPPQVRIEAPPSAARGGSVEVRVVGDVGERMTVTLVPAGSPDSTFANPFFYLSQGAEDRGMLRNLPVQAGDYEIRCKSDWGDRVYARHAIRLQ